MRDFRSTSLADRVFEKLENDIIYGVYPRGELLTELKLVEQLGVSRTPIREALRRLEYEHLIQESGKGSRVLGITEEDVMDIMNIRIPLEGLAAYYATKNMTFEALQELGHILDLQDFYYSKWDVEQLRQADDAFHEKLCILSGRDVIRDVLLPLLRKSRRYRKIALEDRERSESCLREHREIYNAIVAKNPELAQALSEKHITAARAHMLHRER